MKKYKLYWIPMVGGNLHPSKKKLIGVYEGIATTSAVARDTSEIKGFTTGGGFFRNEVGTSEYILVM